MTADLKDKLIVFSVLAFYVLPVKMKMTEELASRMTAFKSRVRFKEG